MINALSVHSYPSEICVDRSGNIYVVDSSGRVRKIDAKTGIISTVAGNGEWDFSGDGGPATEAGMYPAGIFVDGSNNLYIADGTRIRKVDGQTGIITTVAGNGESGFSGDGGLATDASISTGPICLDRLGNIYLAASGRVRKIDAKTGIISTVAGKSWKTDYSGDGGPATEAGMDPAGIFVDGSNNLYISDRTNNRIRKVDGQTGIITTVAGDGFRIVEPTSIGSGILVVYGRFTGDGGPATEASLNNPWSVFLDGAGNLFIADGANRRVRMVDAATGTITTVAGNGTTDFSGDGGPATLAGLRANDIFVDRDGNLFIAGSNRIRKVEGVAAPTTLEVGEYTFEPPLMLTAVSPDSGAVRGGTSITISGKGFVPGATVTVGGQAATDVVAVSETQLTARTPAGEVGTYDIVVTLPDGYATTLRNAFSYFVPPPVLASVSPDSGAVDGGTSITLTGDNFLPEATVKIGGAWATNVVVVSATEITVTTPKGYSGPRDVVVTNPDRQSATLSGGFSYSRVGALTLVVDASVRAIFVDGEQNVYIARSGQIQKVCPRTGETVVVAGREYLGSSDEDVPATEAEISTADFCVDAAGNLYVIGSSSVRKVDATTGIINSLAGSSASSIFVDGAGNLYIAVGRRVQKVESGTGAVSTIAGNGAYEFSGDGGPAIEAAVHPGDIFLDGAGNLFIAGHYRVRKVDAETGIIATVAGNGSYEFSGDGGPATGAGMKPDRIFVDSAGHLYIAGNDRVRKVDAQTGTISTVAGGGQYAGDGKPATDAGIDPKDVFVDGSGALYIADGENYRVWRVEGVGAPTVLDIGTCYAPLVVLPNSGYATGGTPVVLKGADFAAGATVTIGGEVAQDVAVISESRIMATTPPGAQGTQDVAVTCPEGQTFTHSGGFRYLDIQVGDILTVAGTGKDSISADGGPATEAAFSSVSIFVDASGDFYAPSNFYLGCICKVDARRGTTSRIAEGSYHFHRDIIFADGSGDFYVSEVQSGSRSLVQKVSVQTGAVTTVAGGGSKSWIDIRTDGAVADQIELR